MGIHSGRGDSPLEGRMHIQIPPQGQFCVAIPNVLWRKPEETRAYRGEHVKVHVDSNLKL